MVKIQRADTIRKQISYQLRSHSFRKKVRFQKKQPPLLINVSVIFTNIEKLNPFMFSLIDKHTRYFVEGAQYGRPFRSGAWDGFVHLLKEPGTFPTGLLSDIIIILEKCKIPYVLKDKRKHFSIPDANIKDIFADKEKILRPYQCKAVQVALAKRIGTIVLPTGTGKTIIMAAIIAILKGRKFLVLASGVSLLVQLKQQLEILIGEKIGYIGENTRDIQRVTVASIDTLGEMIVSPAKKFVFKSKEERTKHENRIKRFTENQPIALKFLESIECLCLDEAHHSPAERFRATLYACANATLRLGFTATFFRNSIGDNMLLQAVTSGVVYKKSTSWMIRSGFLAKPNIILLSFSQRNGNKAFSKTKKYNGSRGGMARFTKAYSEGVVENDKRNNLIANVANSVFVSKLNALVFVKLKKHGQIINDILVKKYNLGNEVIFVTGNEKGEVREKILEDFRKGNKKLMICTKIFNEGIDIPEAIVGIKAEGLKYEGTQIQQLGRILRKTPNKKGEINLGQEENIFWIDIMDHHDKYLAKHSLERMHAYEGESEFNIDVVRDKDVELLNKAFSSPRFRERVINRSPARLS